MYFYRLYVPRPSFKRTFPSLSKAPIGIMIGGPIGGAAMRIKVIPLASIAFSKSSSRVSVGTNTGVLSKGMTGGSSDLPARFPLACLRDHL